MLKIVAYPLDRGDLDRDGGFRWRVVVRPEKGLSRTVDCFKTKGEAISAAKGEAMRLWSPAYVLERGREKLLLDPAAGGR